MSESHKLEWNTSTYTRYNIVKFDYMPGIERNDLPIKIVTKGTILIVSGLFAARIGF